MDSIYRVVVTAEDRPAGVLCEIHPSRSHPYGRIFFVAAGQTLDVAEELGEEFIDPTDRAQHVRLARLMAMNPGLSSVRLERRELSPWESVEFTRQEAADGY